MDQFTDNYFVYSDANILENQNLREPQIRGYQRLYNHFVIDKSEDDAIIILPTGVGKTGLMAIAPYAISNGRVLIITPQLTIKDTILKELDSSRHNNFFLKTQVFNTANDLPTLIEFDKSLPFEILKSANITIINIQKLQDRLESSPLNFLPSNFYDMIIIDEAHHSAANTWIDVCNHFSNAKVVKVTATPIRSDGKDISGKLVYRYKLSQAMNKGYVKSLKKFEYIPETLHFTLDGDESKTYTPEELFELELKDEDWVSRTVALSTDCSRSVVLESIERLNTKRLGSTVPHKIIAVASSIDHAQTIAGLYTEHGLRSAIIHHKLTTAQKEEVFSDIENNRVDVVVNCSMLGEGYDHKYLSIGAIFRAFKNVLPYAQFVGRVLRAIPDSEISKLEDNIAEIVAHKFLFLDELWEYYKLEIEESDIIKHLSSIDIISEVERENPSSTRETDIGDVIESETGRLEETAYMTTELIRVAQEKEKEENSQIETLMNSMSMTRERAIEALKAIKFMDEKNERLLRPDLLYKSDRKYIDSRIKEEIIPDLIMKYNIDQKSRSLSNLSLFKGKYFWIGNSTMDNGAMLATYINAYLKNELRRKRDEWSTSDCKKALELLDPLTEHIESYLK